MTARNLAHGLIQLAYLCCFCGIEETFSESVDWCALPCQDGEKNTLCLYKPQKNSGSCRNIVTATNPGMRKNLLHLHNDYRNRMANGEIKSKNAGAWPKASDMRQMSWDYDLERLALRWVQQCFDSPPHDKCRRTPAFQNNGQNKGWAGETNNFPSPDGSFKGWVNEIELGMPGIVDKLGNDANVLHFTQVVWAESYKLGCAAINADRQGFKSTILVCNYGPGGNTLGAKIYTRGDPCTNCPAKTSCRTYYAALCASEDDPKTPDEIPDDPGINGSCKPGLFGMRLEKFKTCISSILAIITFLAIRTI